MPAETLQIDVVYALPGRAWKASLELPAGAIVSEAVVASAFASRIEGFDAATLTHAIHGRPVTATTLLRDGDRLELLRPLLADPKQARRRRAERDA